MTYLKGIPHYSTNPRTTKTPPTMVSAIQVCPLPFDASQLRSGLRLWSALAHVFVGAFAFASNRIQSNPGLFLDHHD